MPTNFIVFVTDQHRADHLGCTGHPDLATPHLDHLAARGVRFERSFVANPVCMPNRATLFSGRWPRAHGLRENGMPLSPDIPVLPEVLRQAGYATGCVGKLHLTPYSLKKEQARHPHELSESWASWAEHGTIPTPYFGLEHLQLCSGHGHYVFGHYRQDLDRQHPGAYAGLAQSRVPPTGAYESWKATIPAELHYTTWIADQSIAWIQDQPREKPFFLWCSFPDPHHPYGPPAPWSDRYDPQAIRFAPRRRPGELDDLPPFFRAAHEGRQPVSGLNKDLRQVTDDHLREITAHTYGMISFVDEQIGRVLESLGDRRDDTVVVFLSDHGELLGDHHLLNKGPFLYDGLVRIPTLWSVPGGHQQAVDHHLISSADFAPTVCELAGVAPPVGCQGRSYAGLLRPGEYQPRDALHVEFDEGYLGERLRHLRTDRYALTWCMASDQGYLFDLQADPDELYNRWDDPALAEVRRELQLRLARECAAVEANQPPRQCHA